MSKSIIEMAKEAGDDWDSTLLKDKEFLERFAELVRADERAKLAEQPAPTTYTCGACGVSMRMEQPQQEPDKHQEYIDSLSHDHDGEEKMLAQIFHWARQSYSRHQQLVRGQMITSADSSDNHIIWAALRWAKGNPSPQAQPAREFVGLTDEEIEQGCKESWVTEQAWQSAVWWAEDKLMEKNNA